MNPKKQGLLTLLVTPSSNDLNFTELLPASSFSSHHVGLIFSRITIELSKTESNEIVNSGKLIHAGATESLTSGDCEVIIAED